MKEAYALRSRIGGLLASHIYLQTPTAAQIEERRAEIEYIYGKGRILNDAGIAEELRKQGKKVEDCTPEEIEAVHVSQVNWVAVEKIKIIEGSELDPFVPPTATADMKIGVTLAGTVGT